MLSPAPRGMGPRAENLDKERTPSMRRMFRSIPGWVLVSIALAGCGNNPPGQPPFSKMYVFGDSLSDVGNLHLETGLIPFAPYFEGHFSNGKVWAQHVADRFGLKLLPSYIGGTNYATGGSLTGIGFADLNPGQPIPLGPNVREQINLFPGVFNGTELIAVWGGGNDFFAVLDGVNQLTPQQMADDVFLAVSVLYNRGGRSFVVCNLPDIGKTPSYRGGDQQAEATQLTLEFNAALAARLDQLETLTDITIYRIDVFNLFEQLIANPPPGITNTTEPAWSGTYLGYLGGGTLVPDPDAHVFWDSVHPTQVSHAILGEFAGDVIEAQLVVKNPAVTPLRLGPPPLPPPIALWLAYIENLPLFYANKI
jgi:phospholipase/lecithinase/hemolysin